MKYAYKIIDKTTDEVVASGESNSIRDVTSEYRLAYESGKHLRASFVEL